MTTNSDSPAKPSRRRKRSTRASPDTSALKNAPEVQPEVAALDRPVDSGSAQQEAVSPSAPTPAPRPADVKPRVRLRVWVTACGRRMEHMAGFVRMMQGQKPEKRTMAEWTAAYEKYMNTPA